MDLHLASGQIVSGQLPPGRLRTGARRPHDADADARELDALVRASLRTGIAREAVLLRLSSLPRDLAMPHHLRLAQEAMEPLTGADRARAFVLPNTDMVVVWRGAAPRLLAASRERLGHLFADADRRLPHPESLADHLHLPAAADLLLATAASRPTTACAAPAAAPHDKLDLAVLARLEAALAQADLSRFVRRRPVCTHRADAGFRLAWDTRLILPSELAETLVPDRSLTADRWLFLRLTRTLDRRMLALLGVPDELRHAGAIGLRLNVASLLSAAFLRFDAVLPGRLRGRVVLELRAPDVLADPASFLFARDFAHARGYRVMLHGLPASLAAAFLPAVGGYDHVELDWSEELAAMDPAPLREAAPRLVLGGLDSAAALAWATRIGIALFRGPLAQPNRARRKSTAR